MTTWAYLDGEWVDARAPHLTLSTQGLQYGTSVFEGIRAYLPRAGGRPEPFLAEEHYQRFLRSCEALRIDLSLGCDALVEVTRELIARNGHDTDCYVRPVAFKRTLLPGVPFGVRLTGVGHGLALTSVAMPSRLARETRLGIASIRRVHDDAIPTRAKIGGAYVASALAVDECTGAGYDDALLLTAQGRVAEASTSNILARREKTVFTPSLDQGILPGITRRKVLEKARENGYDVQERPVEVNELFAADEIFLVGTGLEISPVVSLDGCPVGEGSAGILTQDLCRWYGSLVRA